MRVREPAVAGAFYPAREAVLRREVASLLESAGGPERTGPAPKALIVPHAGYVYSGPVAASAYACLAPIRGRIRRVVLLGPAHRVALRGLATPGADAFRTPLGRIPVDREACEGLAELPFVDELPLAHAQEHSLEVQLPFLQVALGAFTLVPLVVGNASDDEVATVIERLWGGPETLLVVSSDLSHYLPYQEARRRDAATCAAIERLEVARLDPDAACGCHPVRGLLVAARRAGLRAETLDLRSSGDTAGPRDQVVGYGAWSFSPARAAPGASPDEPGLEDERALLGLARRSIEHGLEQGEPLAVDATAVPSALRRSAPCFITLRSPDGALRGCLGSLEPEPLARSVAEHAFRSAFEDPRFEPLRPEELAGLHIGVSILGPHEPLEVDSQQALCRVLRPGRDGLILEDGPHRATFLPTVWDELPEPRAFVAALLRKAGLAPDHWSDRMRAWRYESRTLKESDAPPGPSGR